MPEAPQGSHLEDVSSDPLDTRGVTPLAPSVPATPAPKESAESAVPPGPTVQQAVSKHPSAPESADGWWHYPLVFVGAVLFWPKMYAAQWRNTVTWFCGLLATISAVLTVGGMAYFYWTGTPRPGWAWVVLGLWAVLPPVYFWVEFHAIWKTAEEGARPPLDQFRQGQDTSRNIWLAIVVLLGFYFNTSSTGGPQPPIVQRTAPGDSALGREIRLDFKKPDNEGTPEGWTRILDEGVVRAEVRGPEFRIATERASVRYEHLLNIGNPRRLELAWKWKVDRFPADPNFERWNAGGRKDIPRSNAPIQLLAIFREGLTTFYVIHYLWDPAIPVGFVWHEEEKPLPLVTLKYVRTVVHSGPEGQGEWRSERRDLIKDFQVFFPNKAVPPVIRLAIRCSSRFADGEGVKSDASVKNLLVNFD